MAWRLGRRGRRVIAFGALAFLLLLVGGCAFLYFWFDSERVTALIKDRSGWTVRYGSLERHGLFWDFHEPRWHHDRWGDGGASRLSLSLHPVWDRGPRLELALEITGFEWPKPQGKPVTLSPTHPMVGVTLPFSPGHGWWRTRWGYRLVLRESPYSLLGKPLRPDLAVDDLGRVKGRLTWEEAEAQVEGNLLDREVNVALKGARFGATGGGDFQITWAEHRPLEITCPKMQVKGPEETMGTWSGSLSGAWPASGQEGPSLKVELLRGDAWVRAAGKWPAGKPWELRAGASLPSFKLGRHDLTGVNGQVLLGEKKSEGRVTVGRWSGALPFLKTAVGSENLGIDFQGRTWSLLANVAVDGQTLAVVGRGDVDGGPWHWDVEGKKVDLRSLGFPEVQAGTGVKPFVIPPQTARIRLGAVTWGGRSLGPISGALDYRQSQVVFHTTAWSFAGGQGALEVVYSLSNKQGDVSGSLRGAKLTEALQPWFGGTGGAWEGKADLAGKAGLTGSALGEYTLRVKNAGVWRLADTTIQVRLWESPLVSSLKSMEDLLTYAEAEVSGNFSNGTTLVRGTFSSETWRVSLEKLEREGPLWSAALDLDLSDTFLDRYLLPGPLVKAKARPIPADRLPKGWGAGYRLSVSRPKGNAIGGTPPWKIE